MLIAMFQGLVLQKSWGQDIDVDACMAAVDHLVDGFRTKPDAKRKSRRE
jgi:hypothetical protein